MSDPAPDQTPPSSPAPPALAPPGAAQPAIPPAVSGSPPAPPGAPPYAGSGQLAPSAVDSIRAQSHSVLARLDPRGTRPTLAVAAIIVGLFFGAQLVNAVLPATMGPGPAPVPTAFLEVGPLRIHLAGGWQAFEQGPSGPRIARSSVAIDIPSTPWQGDAASLYDVFVNQQLEPHATGFSATDASLVLVGPGIAGARGAYTGVFDTGEVEGQLTVIVVGGTGFVFDAWGPMGTLRPLLGDVELMLEAIEVRQ